MLCSWGREKKKHKIKPQHVKDSIPWWLSHHPWTTVGLGICQVAKLHWCGLKCKAAHTLEQSISVSPVSLVFSNHRVNTCGCSLKNLFPMIDSTAPYEEIFDLSLPSFSRDSSLLPEAVHLQPSVGDGLCLWPRRQQEIWLLEACDRLHLCCRNNHPVCNPCVEQSSSYSIVPKRRMI